MKYGYKTDEKLIRKYEIINNTILIIYLDGSTNTYFYTPEKEEEILNLMLKQAIERSECTYLLEEEKRKRLNSILWILVEIGSISFNFCNSKDIDLSIEYRQLINYVCFAALISELFKCKNATDKINEFKKYDIYLSIKDELESLPIALQETIGCNNLNINLLDSYTLKEIRKMKKELAKIEIDREMFKKYEEEKSLSLKNSSKR